MLITSLIGITAVSGAVNAWFRTHMNWIERIAALRRPFDDLYGAGDRFHRLRALRGGFHLSADQI
jgi:hypothetical protein